MILPGESKQDIALREACDRYNLIKKRLIDSGATSYVFEVQYQDGSRRNAALKVLRPNVRLPGDLVEEARVQKELYERTEAEYETPLVPEVYGASKDHLLMELYSQDEQLKRVRINQRSNWLSTFRNVARVHKILHQDLFMYNGDIKHSSIFSGGRVIDFGSCQSMDPRKRRFTGTTITTIGYGSPEQFGLFRSPIINSKTDVFSLGLTMYHLACGQVPFPFRNMDLDNYVTSLRRITPRKLFDLIHFPEKASELVDNMIKIRPSQRPSMRQVTQTLDELLAA